MRGVVVLLLLAPALAGCLVGSDTTGPGTGDGDGAAGVLDHARIAEAIGAPLDDIAHDHNDVRLHQGAHNVAFVGWSALDVELGENGFANFVVYEDDDEKVAFVAVDGDARGGFAIADISDPADIRPLGHYWTEGNSIQEVRVLPGGEYAVMNVQDLPDPGRFATPDGLKDCTVCLHIVDVRDRTAPSFVGALPVDLLGSHNLHVETYDDGTAYVFYVGQPLTNDPPGNYVGIAQVVEGPRGAELVKVSEYRYEEAAQSEGRSFPHDVLVDVHPVTGQRVAYISHWNDGAIAVDVSDPLMPMELGVFADAAPSAVLQVHWVKQEPVPRPDGRVIAWTAPEIGGLDSGTGVIRALDVTDPTDLQQVGAWGLPGEVIIPGAYMFSGHTAFGDPRTGLVAVGHYHAGVWVLDGSDPAAPRHVGWYQPHGDPAAPYDGPIWWKKPNFDPEGYGPNVYQARWDVSDETLLWVTDRGTGLYALRYTGPVPGGWADVPGDLADGSG